MDGHNRQVNVIEELIVILHRHAGGEEDHQLLLAVLLQECKKQQEALLRWAYHIALGKKHTQFTTQLNTHTHKGNIQNVVKFYKELMQTARMMLNVIHVNIPHGRHCWSNRTISPLNDIVLQ